jgi:hypothetical protein
MQNDLNLDRNLLIIRVIPQNNLDDLKLITIFPGFQIDVLPGTKRPFIPYYVDQERGRITLRPASNLKQSLQNIYSAITKTN